MDASWAWVKPRDVVSAKFAPITTAPLRLALVSVEPARFPPVRLAPLRLALVSVRGIQRRIGEILPAQVPAGQVVCPQTDALQVLRLEAGGGRELGLGEAPRRGVREVCPHDHRPTQVGIGQRRASQIPAGQIGPVRLAPVSVEEDRCAGEILPAEVPAGQVVSPQSDALQVLGLVTSGGLELCPGEATRRGVGEGHPRHRGPGQVGPGQRRARQRRVGEIGPGRLALVKSFSSSNRSRQRNCA